MPFPSTQMVFLDFYLDQITEIRIFQRKLLVFGPAIPKRISMFAIGWEVVRDIWFN